MRNQNKFDWVVVLATTLHFASSSSYIWHWTVVRALYGSVPQVEVCEPF
jgi:hypothetical protein